MFKSKKIVDDITIILESKLIKPNHKIILILLRLYGRMSAPDLAIYSKISLRAVYYSLENMQQQNIVKKMQNEYTITANALKKLCKRAAESAQGVQK